jgi:riboflavin biosynthesis pyrimidine reductase
LDGKPVDLSAKPTFHQGMVASLVELSDAASVDRAARALFGGSLDTRPPVSHSFAAWRAAPDKPLTTIKINEHGPKSELDWLALHIARARADAIVITGKILRDEPSLSFSLRADPRWGDALESWRERHWGLCDSPWILILTAGGEIDFEHPVFHGWGRPLIFTSDRTATRKLAAAPCPVVSDEAPDIRRAIQHLQLGRDCECVSIEAGPSTARGLYERPIAVRELLLSVYLEPSLDERAQGEPLVMLSEVRELFRSETSAAHRDHGQHWSFHRLRR